MKKLLVLAFVSVLLFACKKEDTIKKNLYSKGGVWDISKVEEVKTTTPGETEKTLTTDVGFIVFKEDGTGKMVVKTDSTVVEGTDFDYYLEDGQFIAVTAEDGKIYQMNWAKNRIVLEWTEKYQYFNPVSNDTVYVNHVVTSTCNKRK